MFIILLSSCANTTEYLVQIEGQINNTVFTRGTGWKMRDDTVLTAAHVVPDDRGIYTVNNDVWYLVYRDFGRDIALLSVHTGTIVTEWNMYTSHVGDTVKIPVWREGSVTWLTGSIIATGAYHVAYADNGAIRHIGPVVHTDMRTEVGDSGAPIFDVQGNIVDVVHIVQE